MKIYVDSVNEYVKDALGRDYECALLQCHTPAVAELTAQSWLKFRAWCASATPS